MECLVVGQYSEEEEDVRRKDTPPQGKTTTPLIWDMCCVMTHRILIVKFIF